MINKKTNYEETMKTPQPKHPFLEKHIFTENDNRKNKISVLCKSEYRARKVVKIKYPKITFCYDGVDTSNYGDVNWEYLNN